MNCYICNKELRPEAITFGNYYNISTSKGHLLGRVCMGCVEKDIPEMTICGTCNKSENDDCQCWD